jgi:hypothetical protein
MKFVTALNMLSSPILAIVVMLLGCVFAVISKVYGIDGNMAAGIIGAGIGLLTGQVIATTRTHFNDGNPASGATSQVTEKPAAQIASSPGAFPSA